MPADDAPIPYLSRIRAYYQGLGYGEPYRWAAFAEVPFSRLSKPLNECRVALLTTAARYRPELGDQGPGAPHNGAAKFFQVYSQSIDDEADVRISHIAYDRQHTTALDMGTWFPLAALRRAAARGRIGGVAPRFHGLPTDRSQAATLARDCPDVLARLGKDKADAAVIVPNCPVCHQTAALTARHLEQNGIATVIMGCAKDIVEHIGVPRLLFSDFPLGNGAGRPHDVDSQDLTLDLALELLTEAPGPRSTRQSPLRWPGPAGWKLDYSNIERLSPEEIAARRAGFDRGKAAAKKQRGQEGRGQEGRGQAGRGQAGRG